LISGGDRGRDMGNSALSRSRRFFAQQDHRKSPSPKGRIKNITDATTITGTCHELLLAACGLGIIVAEGVGESATWTELMVEGMSLPSVITGPRYVDVCWAPATSS